MKRNFVPELGECSIMRCTILIIIENFFIYSDNVRFHEYLFVYLIDIQTPDWQIEDFINLENPRMHMEWYNKENYLQLNIKPSILKDILTDDSFKHLIIKE